jgi:hypothetical protein
MVPRRQFQRRHFCCKTLKVIERIGSRSVHVRASSSLEVGASSPGWSRPAISAGASPCPVFFELPKCRKTGAGAGSLTPRRRRWIERQHNSRTDRASGWCRSAPGWSTPATTPIALAAQSKATLPRASRSRRHGAPGTSWFGFHPKLDAPVEPGTQLITGAAGVPE